MRGRGSRCLCDSGSYLCHTSSGMASSIRMSWYSEKEISPSPSVSKLAKKSLPLTAQAHSLSTPCPAVHDAP